MLKWVGAVSLVAVLAVGAYLFMRPDEVTVYWVSVGADGTELTMELGVCMPGGYSIHTREYEDRVVIKFEGEASNSDCSTHDTVELDEPLRNRVVILGTPPQTFAFCGSDSLCKD